MEARSIALLKDRIQDLQLKNHRLEVLLTEYRGRDIERTNILAENITLKKKVKKLQDKVKVLRQLLQPR
jgi:hypothetical protein